MKNYDYYLSQEFRLTGKPMASYRRRVSDVEVKGLIPTFLNKLWNGVKWFWKEITVKNPEY